MVENIAILLDSEVDNNERDIICLPSEEEIMEALKNSKTDKNTATYQPQTPLAVRWDNDEGRYWSLGFFIDELEDNFCRIDHLKMKESIWQLAAAVQ